jgi:hypothetical protein
MSREGQWQACIPLGRNSHQQPSNPFDSTSAAWEPAQDSPVFGVHVDTLVDQPGDLGIEL